VLASGSRLCYGIQNITLHKENVAVLREDGHDKIMKIIIRRQKYIHDIWVADCRWRTAVISDTGGKHPVMYMNK
jgi:hypothetical protein